MGRDRILEIAECDICDHGASPAGSATAHRSKFVILEAPWDVVEGGLQGLDENLVRTHAGCHRQLGRTRRCWRGAFLDLETVQRGLDHGKVVGQCPLAYRFNPDQEFGKVLVIAEVELAQGCHAILVFFDPVKVEDGAAIVDGT